MDAILTSPQQKGATRFVLSPQVRQTRELAPERWLSTRRIITPQLAEEHCFSTPLAQITLRLELTRLSITTTAPKTTPSAQMRSLVTSAVLSTTPLVAAYLGSLRPVKTMGSVTLRWRTIHRAPVTQ